MQSITNGIYYENAFAGVTLGAIIQSSGTLMIDTPLRADESRSWKSILLTQSRGTHRLLVNLDEHPDRTIGNRAMDITILAHQKTAESFEQRGTVFKGGNYENGEHWEKHPETIGSRWTPPKITFSDKIQLNWGESPITLEYHPGPSAGAIWVEIPSAKVVFIGDAVIKDQPPFLANADIPIWLKTIDILRSRKYRDYTIVSGRSGIIEKDDVQAQNALLKYILQRMEKLADRNSPAEEIENIIPIALSKINFPEKHSTFYTYRLQYGLSQYYSHHYLPSDLQSEN